MSSVTGKDISHAGASEVTSGENRCPALRQLPRPALTDATSGARYWEVGEFDAERCTQIQQQIYRYNATTMQFYYVRPSSSGGALPLANDSVSLTDASSRVHRFTVVYRAGDYAPGKRGRKTDLVLLERA